MRRPDAFPSFPRWRRARPAAALAALLATAGPALAGSLTLHAVAPERYADAGRTEGERERSVGDVERLLKALAATRLPADASLDVELLDLDLTGHLVPTPRGERRIARGAVDGPAMTLRWRLERPGAAPQTGTDDLRGFDLQSSAADATRDDGLRHERRLLERWFAQRFPEKAAP